MLKFNLKLLFMKIQDLIFMQSTEARAKLVKSSCTINVKNMHPHLGLQKLDCILTNCWSISEPTALRRC